MPSLAPIVRVNPLQKIQDAHQEVITRIGKAIPVSPEEKVKSSISNLTVLTSFVSAINELGKVSQERPEVIGIMLTHLAIYEIFQRSQHREIPLEQNRLLSVYSASHDSKIDLPEWFSSVHHHINLLSSKSEFLEPDIYLASSPSVAQNHLTQIRSFNYSIGEYRRLMATTGAGPETDELLGTIDRLRNEMDGILFEADDKGFKLKDIHPENIKSVTDRLSVNACVNPQIILAMQKSHEQLSNIIVSLAQNDSVTSDFSVITLKQDKPYLEVVEQKEQFFTHKDLPVLLQSYLSLRQGMSDTLKILVASDNDKLGYNTEIQGLEKALSSSFVTKEMTTEDIVVSLSSKLQSKSELVGIACQKICNLAVKEKRFVSVLEESTNLKVLDLVVKELVNGDQKNADFISATLQGSTLDPIIKLGRNIRGLIEKKKYDQIALMIDNELTRLKPQTSYPEAIAVLLVIDSIIENTDIKSKVKGGITKIAQMEVLINNLVGHTKNVKTATEHIEIVRARITRGLKYDLGDYLGNHQVVQKWKNELGVHLKLADNLAALGNVTKTNVFQNGYLLYGKPGTGKTFLVNCMANELGLALVEIKREEMKDAMDSAKNNAKDAEKTLDEFLKKKLDEAKKTMQNTGAKSCMIFIDEMEAEFLKREPGKDHSHFEMTNTMLRVIEAQMAANPTMIFVGATNHIDVVDEAAHRMKRFGYKIKVDVPDREGAITIIDSLFKTLGITKNYAKVQEIKTGEPQVFEPEYEELIKEAIGLVPSAIIVAVNQSVILQRLEGLKEVDLKLILQRLKTVKNLLTIEDDNK